MRDIQAAEPRVPVLATLLILLLVMPTAAAAHMDARITDDERDREGRDNPAESTGSLSFDIEKVGHRYPVAGNDDLYSLTSYLSALGPSESSELSSESTQTSGRQSCNNRHVQGDVVTIPYPAGNAHSATGNVDYEVVRIATPSVGGGEAAILVEQAVLGTFSETDRTNMANEWANTIWPDVTSVFQLSSSLRDADDNCQIQVVLTTMDGGGGTGGYFWSYWE
ncbi:MAG: hypothetical protein CL992_03825, partial [Euryarchaeota archaeon]|nr:hypothetical protein [Euryarchaeota archaeon]